MYYLYRHIRLDRNEPFYIGVGKKLKKYSSHGQEYKRAYCKRRNNIWSKIASKTEYQVEIIYECNTENEIKQKEQEFIALYGRKDNNSGSLANLTDGGDGILNPSKETILKIINSNKNRTVSEKTKEKISASKIKNNTKLTEDHKRVFNFTNKKHKKETKVRIGNTHRGKILSYETKEKIRNSKLGVKQSQEQITNRITKIKKPILQYTKNNEFIKEFDSIKKASVELSINKSDISNCCIGNRKSAGGYTFKYKN